MLLTGEDFADDDAAQAALDAFYLFHLVTLKTERCERCGKFFRRKRKINVAFQPLVRDIHKSMLLSVV